MQKILVFPNIGDSNSNHLIKVVLADLSLVKMYFSFIREIHFEGDTLRQSEYSSCNNFSPDRF